MTTYEKPINDKEMEKLRKALLGDKADKSRENATTEQLKQLKRGFEPKNKRPTHKTPNSNRHN